MMHRPQPPATVQTVVPSSSTPVPRRALDAGVRPLRWMIGTAFVVYSALTTIVFGALDVRLLLRPFPYGPLLTVALPILLAVVIFIIQVYAEHVPPLYYLSLIPDTWYSARLPLWAGTQVALLDGQMAAQEVYTAVAISVTISFIVARFGEVLLFGWRRTDRWWNMLVEYCYTLAVCGGVLWWFG